MSENAKYWGKVAVAIVGISLAYLIGVSQGYRDGRARNQTPPVATQTQAPQPSFIEVLREVRGLVKDTAASCPYAPYEVVVNPVTGDIHAGCNQPANVGKVKVPRPQATHVAEAP